MKIGIRLFGSKIADLA